MKQYSTRRAISAFATMTFALGLVSCGEDGSTPQADASASEADSTSGTSFYDGLRVSGDEVEGFQSLDQMADSADLILRGQIRSVSLGRQHQGDAAEDLTSLASVTVAVSRTVRGTPTDTIDVEFLLPVTADKVDERIEQLSESLPKGDVVLFLREKKAPEDGRFRLVNSTGLWTEDEAGLATPLHESLDGYRVSYGKDTSTYKTLDDLVGALSR
jgi:hypothetical protein